MEILILGGNGYIGSKVTRELIKKGHNIVCTKRTSSNLSRLSEVSGYIKWIPASIDAVDAVMQYNSF